MKNRFLITFLITGLVFAISLSVINSCIVFQIYGILKTNIHIESLQTKLINALADSVWGIGDTHKTD